MSVATEAGTWPSGTRLVALWVPDWPVVAALNEGLAGAHQPVALHDGRGVVALSAQARAQGVRRGMRRRSAQAMCPDLVLLRVDEGRDVRAFEPVLQALEEVVPLLVPMRPGLVLTGARGPTRYLGGEMQVAQQLVGAAAEAGAEAQVGIADGLLAAVLAARGDTVLAPGTSAAYLAGRDMRELIHVTTTRQARAEMTELTGVLRRLGLHTLGGLAELPRRQVHARFGALGEQAQRLARGLDAHPPQAPRPEPDLTSSADLDPPASRLDVAAFAARRLAEELHQRMVRRGVLCGLLRVLARTSEGGELVRTWRIDGALSASELTDRVRWQLDGWLSGRSGRPPSAPLTHLALTAEEVMPAAAVQEGLWGQTGRGERQAGRAALRIQGLLGADGVLAPVAEGGRAPRDRIRLVAWGDELSPVRDPGAPWPGQIPRPLPARVPANPVPVQLLDAEGAPVRVDERGHLSGAPDVVLDVVHAGDGGAAASGEWSSGAADAGRPGGDVPCRRLLVSGWAGPWPVVERWWTGRAERSYLQVTGAGHALLLGGDAEGWWVEGIYD